MKEKNKQIWHLAKNEDLQVIQKIGDDIHSQLLERPEILLEKYRLFPQGCFVLKENDKIVGYAVIHPWNLNHAPSLDTFLEQIPDNPECLHLHDIAVLPEARGHNAAQSFMQIAVRMAVENKLKYLSLVSVYNTHTLWSRFGFEIHPTDLSMKAIESYGQTA